MIPRAKPLATAGSAESGAMMPAIRMPAVYSWFVEGFDTTCLRDAKVLLDELRDLIRPANSSSQEVSYGHASPHAFLGRR